MVYIVYSWVVFELCCHILTGYKSTLNNRTYSSAYRKAFNRVMKETDGDKDLRAYLSSRGCLIVGCAVCLVWCIFCLVCFMLSCMVYICLAGCVILACGLSYMAPWQATALVAAQTAGKAAVAQLHE